MVFMSLRYFWLSLKCTYKLSVYSQWKGINFQFRTQKLMNNLYDKSFITQLD